MKTGFVLGDGSDLADIFAEKESLLNDIKDKDLFKTNLGIGTLSNQDNDSGLIYPVDTGKRNQIIVTDGNKNLSWAEPQMAESDLSTYVTTPDIVGPVEDVGYTTNRYEATNSSSVHPSANGDITYSWEVSTGANMDISGTGNNILDLTFTEGETSYTEKIYCVATDNLGNKSQKAELEVGIFSIDIPFSINIVVADALVNNSQEQLDVTFDDGGEPGDVTFSWSVSHDYGETWDTVGFSDPTIKNPLFDFLFSNHPTNSVRFKVEITNTAGIGIGEKDVPVVLVYEEDPDSEVTETNKELISSELYTCTVADSETTSLAGSITPIVGKVVLADGVVTSFATVEAISAGVWEVTTANGKSFSSLKNMKDEYEVPTINQQEGQPNWGQIIINVVMEGQLLPATGIMSTSEFQTVNQTYSLLEVGDTVGLKGDTNVITKILDIERTDLGDGNWTTTYTIQGIVPENLTNFMEMSGGILANIGAGALVNAEDMTYSWIDDTSYSMVGKYWERGSETGNYADISIYSGMSRGENIDIISYNIKLYNSNQNTITGATLTADAGMVPDIDITLGMDVEYDGDPNDLGYTWWIENYIDGSVKNEYLSSTTSPNPVMNIPAGSTVKIHGTVFNLVNSIDLETEFFRFTADDFAFEFNIDAAIQPSIDGVSDIWTGDTVSISNTDATQTDGNGTEFYIADSENIAFFHDEITH